MKISQKVETKFGSGVIIFRESEEGFLSRSYIVKLDDCPEEFLYLQEEQGGLAFLDKELKLSKGIS